MDMYIPTSAGQFVCYFVLLHNHVTLTLSQCMPSSCIEYMCTKFGVGIAGVVFLSERGHTHTHRRNTPPMHASDTAGGGGAGKLP